MSVDGSTAVLRIALLLIVPLLAASGNLSFLRSSPVAYFKGDDHALMMENFKTVLESEEPHAQRQWRNPKTGSHGLAQVRGEFTATDGVPCKRVRIVNHAGGVESDATYAVCKYPNRGWLANPDAEPAQPDSKSE